MQCDVLYKQRVIIFVVLGKIFVESDNYSEIQCMGYSWLIIVRMLGEDCDRDKEKIIDIL